MRKIIYISAISGMLQIVFGIIGPFYELPASNLLLYIGLGLTAICLPVFFVYKHQERKAQDRAIKNAEKQKKSKEQKTKAKSKTKGWSMNNSPFRNRKSGLTWGGGNVHASNASRGGRKNFGR